MANHLRTAALLLERKSLADIAAKLGWTSGTIAGHVERLVEEGRCPDIEYLRPAPGPFEEMKRLFVEHGTEKLRPVFDALEGRVSFDDLKIVRALMMLEKKREVVAA